MKLTDGSEEALTGRNSTEKQKLGRAIVVLIRNTTWRCGKLERLIVKHLYKRTAGFGKSEISIRDMVRNFNLTSKQKSELFDAIRRLERRNIIRILNLVN
jgi:hypothetical protein